MCVRADPVKGGHGQAAPSCRAARTPHAHTPRARARPRARKHKPARARARAHTRPFPPSPPQHTHTLQSPVRGLGGQAAAAVNCPRMPRPRAAARCVLGRGQEPWSECRWWPDWDPLPPPAAAVGPDYWRGPSRAGPAVACWREAPLQQTVTGAVPGSRSRPSRGPPAGGALPVRLGPRLLTAAH